VKCFSHLPKTSGVSVGAELLNAHPGRVYLDYSPFSLYPNRMSRTVHITVAEAMVWSVRSKSIAP